MKTYILTLQGCEERAEAVSRRLAGSPFGNARPFLGFDGRKSTQEELDRLMDVGFFQQRHHRLPTRGEIGCAVSHRRIWQEIAASGAPALIFEDDILPTREISESEANALTGWLSSRKPRVLLLCDSVIYNPRKKRRIEGSDAEIAPAIEAEGTFSYAVNPAAARILTSGERCNTVADDWALYKSLGIDVSATIPAAYKAIIEGSLIGSDRKETSVPLLRRIRLFLDDKRRRLLLATGLRKHL